jgi:hypothetical protein
MACSAVRSGAVLRGAWQDLPFDVNDDAVGGLEQGWR